MEVGFVSDIGRNRKINQDTIYSSNNKDLPLYLVADGMGGYKAGEVASSMAKTIIVEKFKSVKEPIKSDEDILALIKESIEEANTKIYLKSTSNKEDYKGMGTTLTLAYLANNKLYIGHVGDTRAYLIRGDKIKQITEDHSFVNQLIKTGAITEEEGKNHPKKNLITRAVGSSSILEIDLLEEDLIKGDIIVLTSDGLTNMLDDLEILKEFKLNGSIEKTCESLVKKANYNGGRDNISIVAIKLNKEVKA